MLRICRITLMIETERGEYKTVFMVLSKKSKIILNVIKINFFEVTRSWIFLFQDKHYSKTNNHWSFKLNHKHLFTVLNNIPPLFSNSLKHSLSVCEYIEKRCNSFGWLYFRTWVISSARNMDVYTFWIHDLSWLQRTMYHNIFLTFL